MDTQTIPWIEKYRPTQFEDIVLEPINRTLFENILEKNYIPNLLFYGPPGTGKTTTIINLINQYQEKYNQKYKENIIHLNASDERGIDIIRNQIQQFVKSYSFFNTGLKFVILDEVDYMTKNAQQALKYLIQTSNSNVRYCLICNYISKIDVSLINEFISIRFNQLPTIEISNFIESICKKESIAYNQEFIDGLIHNYQSDIRSMINYIQLHHQYNIQDYKLVNDKLWIDMKVYFDRNDGVSLKKYIHELSIEYNVNKKNLLISYFYYLFRNHHDNIKPKQYSLIEHLSHESESSTDNYIDYLCYDE
tara:strand:- start:4797 stop:5717 length:921 start_codon:yes stop_codon:yes gene_type:complete